MTNMKLTTFGKSILAPLNMRQDRLDFGLGIMPWRTSLIGKMTLLTRQPKGVSLPIQVILFTISGKATC